MANPTPPGAGSLSFRCVTTLAARSPRHRNRQRHLHLFLCEAQFLFRSRDGAPILPHRLQLLPVDEPVGIYRHARPRFVHHGIDFSKGFPIAHNLPFVLPASPMVLGYEDVPSLRQLSQGRGVAVIRFLIDQERNSLRQTLPIFLFSKTHVLECGHVFAVAEDLGVCPISHMPSQKAETATSGLAAVAVSRYRCVSLVCAGMVPKTWSLVQSVIHGRWSAELYLGSRPRVRNRDDDPSWARNLRVGRDGKPSGACSVNVGDKEGSIAQTARFGATGPARVRDGDITAKWIPSDSTNPPTEGSGGVQGIRELILRASRISVVQRRLADRKSTR